MNLYRNQSREIKFEGKNQALLILSEANLFYFTRYSNADAAILLTEDKNYYVCDRRVALEASETLSNYEIVDCGFKSYAQAACDLAIAKGIRLIGFEKNTVKYSQYSEIVNGKNYRLIGADKLIENMRATKEAYECELINKAQSITDSVFSEVLKYVRKGITERELQAYIDASIHSKGGKCAFETIAAFGENTSKPHAHPSERKLDIGDPVTIDFGAYYGGYCSDMTRSFCYGAASDEYISVYEAVLGAQETAIARIKAGMTGCECHEIALNYLNERGLGQYFTHSLGHSLGIEIHEAPNLSPRYSGKIPLGAVTSVEPGAYIQGKFGIRIEDIVVFGKYGVENLTNSPKNLIIIE